MSSTTAQDKRKTFPRGLMRVDYWFQNISSADLKFVGVLWSSEFIFPWVQAWAQEPQHQLDEPKSIYFLICYWSLLIVKLICTIIVSIVVDLRNHKFIVYLISLFVFSVSPVCGIVASIVYDDAKLYFFPLFFTASVFVTYPTKFCLIFDQSPNPNVTDTRKLVSLFELIRSLSMFVLFVFLLFIKREFTVYTLIIGWILFIVLIAGLLLLTLLVKEYAIKEVIKESTFVGVFNGIKQDITGNHCVTVHVQRFIVFILLLLPFFVITIVDIILTVLNEFASNNVDHSSLNVHKFLAKLVVVPAIGVLLSVAKGTFGRLGDLLVIAVAHLFNITVIFLIVQYFRTDDIIIDTRSIIDRSSNAIIGYLPNAERAVVRIFCASDKKYILRTTTFNYSDPKPWEEFEVYVKHSSLKFEIQIQKRGDDKSIYLKTEVKPNKRYWFLVLESGDEFTEVIQINGVDEYWHLMNPKLILLNGIAGDADIYKFELYEEGSNTNTSYSLPPNNMTVNIVLKRGAKYQFYYESIKSNLTEYSPYSEYTVVVYKVGLGYSIQTNITLQIRPNLVKRDQQLLHASYVLNGLTQAATSVGYLNFFWLESPLRLRTTLLACFFITNEIVAELTKVSIDFFGFNEAIACLVLSTCAGFFHVSLGTLYELRFRHDLVSAEETLSKKSSAPQAISSPSPAPQPSTSSILVPETVKAEEKRGWFK